MATNDSRESTVGALLTEEAQRAVWATPHSTLADFIEFHRTEGREALVEAVARTMFEAMGPNKWEDWRSLHDHWRSRAEAVVTALVGEAKR